MCHVAAESDSSRRTGTALTLLFSEIALGASSAAGAIAAILSTALLAPVIAPRWSSSAVEASTVPLAAVGVLVFWVILPIAGAGRAAGLSDADLADCPLVRLIPV